MAPAITLVSAFTVDSAAVIGTNEPSYQRRAPLRLPGLGGAIQQVSAHGCPLSLHADKSDRKRAFCAILTAWIARVDAGRSLPDSAACSARILQGREMAAEVEGDGLISTR